MNSRRAFLALGGAFVLRDAIGAEVAPGYAAPAESAADTCGRYVTTGEDAIGAATPQDFMSTDERSAVAGRTRSRDVTAAVVRMFACGARKFFFPPGDYPISMTEGRALVRFVAATGCEIIGQGAVLWDPHVYLDGSVFSPVFELENCSNFRIAGLDYAGVPIPHPRDKVAGVGYRGATFINLKSGCYDVQVTASLQHLRYGVRSGDFVRPEHGHNRKIRTSLRTYRCGYPIAHYLAEQVHAELHAESSHRAAYLAGVKGFDVVADFKDQNIAPIQVLLTDAMESPGKSRGCSSGRVLARDLGSVNFVPNSWCAGIALSRVDAGTTFEDIDIRVEVVGTDRVATTLGGCAIVSSANAFLPAYEQNWERSITLRRISISGVVDRSAQTLPGNGAADLYIKTIAAPDHFATVVDLDFSQLKIIPASSRYRSVYCLAPGLSGSSAETRTMCASGR